MTAGQRILRRTIDRNTWRRPGLASVLWVLFVVATAILVIGAGVVWPIYVVVTILPTDPYLAGAILAIVGGGWAWTAWVWRWRWRP
jgi:hypothetical protein